MKTLLLIPLCTVIVGCASKNYDPVTAVKVSWAPYVVKVASPVPLVTYQGSTYNSGNLSIAIPNGPVATIGGAQIQADQNIRNAANAVQVLDSRRVTLGNMLITYAGVCTQQQFLDRLDSYNDATDKITQLALMLDSKDTVAIAKWNAKYTTQPISSSQAATATQQKTTAAASPPPSTSVPNGIASTTKATPITTAKQSYGVTLSITSGTLPSNSSSSSPNTPKAKAQGPS